MEWKLCEQTCNYQRDRKSAKLIHFLIFQLYEKHGNVSSVWQNGYSFY